MLGFVLDAGAVVVRQPEETSSCVELILHEV